MARWAGIVAITLVGGWWVSLSAARLAQWPDERGLWAEAARLAPHKPRTWMNLGNQERLQGNGAAAHEAYAHAFRVAQDPSRSADERNLGQSFALANLGAVALDDADVPLARRCFHDAMGLNPQNGVLQDTWRWFAQQYPDEGSADSLPPLCASAW